MDVQMPAMSGLEASAMIRALEADGERLRTPIIALTGFTGDAERQRCLASGMDDFTTKPLAVATAATLMREHVKAT
jgi:CheY-like chemotaxis protein